MKAGLKGRDRAEARVASPSADFTEPVLDSPRDERPPDRLGDHPIEGVIGRGAMGVVYDALDRDGTSRVAIKVLRGISPEARYRFKREFRTLATITHPNVVALYELAQEGEHLYFTMERIDGSDVIEHLCGPPPGSTSAGRAPCRDFARLRTIFRQLVEGIRVIHRAGFLHRDIKPSNILVTTQGRAVLLDFGLVRDLQLDRAVGVTADGAVLGTPLYMSPEQAAGEDAVKASDWYSLGEVLYEALVGRPPYAGLGMMGLLTAKREAPPPVEQLVPDVPPDLGELCRDLMRPEPDDRPTAEELLVRLGAGLGTEAFGTTTSDVPFVGRAEELDRLWAAYTSDRQRARVCIVEGPSGIGKTVLVQRFVDRAIERDGAIVLSGRCSERESIPYKALDSVMDHLSAFLRGQVDTARAQRALPRHIHALVRLFPVLQSVPAVALTRPRSTQAVDPTELKRRGTSGLRDLLGRLCLHHDLIVVIDDLQWSDVDSLRLLLDVLQHPDAPPFMLVATARPVDDVPRAELPHFMRSLESTPTVTLERVRVGPMSAAEGLRLALDLLGPPHDESSALAQHITREAEGSPFFIAELVRYASDPATSQLTDDTFTNLDEVIVARIDRLPAEARLLLEVLAVAGGRLSSDTTRYAATVTPIGSGAHARLRAEHLVRGGGAEAGPLEIDHDRIRVATVAQISAERLPRIHLDIANALASSGHADEVALSHHYRQAGEEDAACRHTLAAAERAVRALAFDRAGELYETALELSALRDAERTDVEARLGEALANAGNLHRSGRAYLRAAASVRDERRIEWMRRAAENFLTSGYHEEGMAALREILPAVGLSLPTSRARAVADLLSQRALLRLGFKVGRRIRLRARSEIPPAALHRLDLCWTTSRGLVYTDGLLGAEFHARHLRLALRCGEPIRISRALGAEAHLTAAVAPVDKTHRIERLLDQAAEIAEDADDECARGMVAEARGHVAMLRGEFRLATQEMDRAVSTFRRRTTGTAQDVAYCRAHGAICLQYLGQIRRLRPRARALLSEAKARDNLYVEGFARGILGNLALLSIDAVDEAQEHMKTYRRDAPRRYQAHRLNYVCQWAALERYRGRPEVAWRQAEQDYESVAKLDLLRSAMAKGEFLLWQAGSALAAAAASPERARTSLLQRARKPAEALLETPLRYSRAYGNLSVAGIDALEGNDNEAVFRLRRAIVAFEGNEMAAFAAVATARLAALVGGSEGQELGARAGEYFDDQGVVNRARLVAMLAPGFTPDA